MLSLPQVHLHNVQHHGELAEEEHAVLLVACGGFGFFFGLALGFFLGLVLGFFWKLFFFFGVGYFWWFFGWLFGFFLKVIEFFFCFFLLKI